MTTITPEQLQRIEGAPYRWLLDEILCDEYAVERAADLTIEQAADIILDIDRWEAAE